MRAPRLGPSWFARPIALVMVGAVITGAGSTSSSLPPARAERVPAQVSLPMPTRSLELGTRTVLATVPWRGPDLLWGWGTLHLRAEPREDELHVDLRVDGPRREARWATCDHLVVRGAGVERRFTARAVGGRLGTGGHYDAVHAVVGIAELRALARDEDVVFDVCGDRVRLDDADRRAIGAFVGGFDRVEGMTREPRAPEGRLAPNDPDEVIDDPDLWLEPA